MLEIAGIMELPAMLDVVGGEEGDVFISGARDWRMKREVDSRLISADSL